MTKGAARAFVSKLHPYESDADAIYARSFAEATRELAELDGQHGGASLEGDAYRHALAVRVAHTCGSAEPVRNLRWAENLNLAAVAARLSQRQMAVWVDCTMVQAGIPRYETRCVLNDPQVRAIAARHATTRSAAQVELWRGGLEGALVAIGNAPTALFHLLEVLAADQENPALIIGVPVGYVGAVEAKEALMASPHPWICLQGRFGGSAIAAAMVNSLLSGGGASRGPTDGALGAEETTPLDLPDVGFSAGTGNAE